MAKTITTIYIESEIKNQIVKQGYNISKTVEEHFQHLINVHQKDVKGLDKELLERNIKKVDSKISALVRERDSYRTQVNEIMKNQDKKKEEEIRREKEEVEKMTKCMNCGDFVGEKIKKHSFPIGNICNACFLTSNADQHKEWNRKPQKSD